MIGKVLGARYEISEIIDTGGMAYVYKATCKKTKSDVAIKVLKEEFTANQEYISRFKKEAHAVFSFEHDNVVRVKDVGFDEGVYYMVMEYIDGPSLKTLIEDKTKISEKSAVEYAIQICSGLLAAHKKGIIHRDIKPQNILLDKDGKIKIADFGIAKSVSAEEKNEKHVLGSVYYISPEQAKGERIDARTDVYSLGILLYEMLTGELPYTGDKTIAVALKHINEQMTPPSEKNAQLSAAINAIVIKACSKTKKDRYQSMKEFKDDLVRALVDPDGSFVSMPLPVFGTGIIKAVHERKNNIWKICVLIVLIAVVVSVVVVGADVITAGEQAVVVPDFVGFSQTYAEKRLVSLGLTMTVVEEPSEIIKEGLVISQTPESGAHALASTVVTLTISSGPADLVMPDVTSMTQDEAKGVIAEMGLELASVENDYSEGVMPGNVISQMPEAGTTIFDNDKVTLVVSSEQAAGNVVMPEVIGLPLDQAVGILNEAGLFNCFVYQDEYRDEAPGTVVQQTPGQGLQTTQNADVDLWISQYTDTEYVGHLRQPIDISEKESKITMVLKTEINGKSINFVKETKANAGPFVLHCDFYCATGGSKPVTIYINNIETMTVNVNFDERSIIE